MRVPHIHRDWVAGRRSVWAPEMVDAPAPNPAAGVAGSKIADILRGMGRTATAGDLRAAVGRSFSRQITAALSNGLVQEVTPGVFSLVKSK